MFDFDKILSFWFAGVTDATIIDKNALPFRNWFAKSEKFDREIQEKFEFDLLKARRGEYQNWESSVKGRLALVILFDQFSRNMYRNTPKMFENDALALALTLRTIQEGWDVQLQLIERVFIYLPLMHSEDLKVQKMSVEHFDNVVVQAKERFPKNVSYFENNFFYAKKYCAIIAKFGRFPHRNAVLGRASSSQELEFLQKPGSGF